MTSWNLSGVSLGKRAWSQTLLFSHNVQIRQEQLPVAHTGSGDPQGASHVQRTSLGAPHHVVPTLRALRSPALLSHAVTSPVLARSWPAPDRRRAGSEGKYAGGSSGVYGAFYRLIVETFTN